MTKERKYKRTHPWLTFSVDLTRAPADLWIALGECQSKCEHITQVPLRPETAHKLLRLYLAKGVHATTAIEGNTLTEEEVLRRLEDRLPLPPSREYLGKEVDNIEAACNKIAERLNDVGAEPLEIETICQLNQQVLNNLPDAEQANPGQFRRHSVGVGRYRGAPAEDCRFLIQKLCDWINGDVFRPPVGMEVLHAVLKAILAHLYLAWIHPFADGNGRTARLVEFRILLSSGLPGPATHLLSNHYNLTRTQYYAQLERASKTGGDVIPFIQYAVQGFRDGLGEQLKVIWDQQWDVAWRNYVHEKFRDTPSVSQRRKRDLILDLSRQAGPVPVSAVRGISSRVANAYATMTDRTLRRDIQDLIEMNLVAKTQGGLRANKERILAFRPLTIP